MNTSSNTLNLRDLGTKKTIRVSGSGFLLLYRIQDILPWLHTPHHIFNVLSDLIGGLQTEEVKVPQQVVVEGQELEIQLG